MANEKDFLAGVLKILIVPTLQDAFEEGIAKNRNCPSTGLLFESLDLSTRMIAITEPAMKNHISANLERLAIVPNLP